MDKQVTVSARFAGQILDSMFTSVVDHFCATIGDLDGRDLYYPTEILDDAECLEWFTMLTNGFKLDISVNYEKSNAYPTIRE